MSELLGRDAATRYVGARFALAPERSLVEVRFRVASGMRRFFTAGASPALVDAVAALATRTAGGRRRARQGGLGGLRHVRGGGCSAVV